MRENGGSPGDLLVPGKTHSRGKVAAAKTGNFKVFVAGVVCGFVGTISTMIVVPLILLKRKRTHYNTWGDPVI